MKRPEYVAVVTGVYSRAIRENREPTLEELEQLRLAFSRDGFTDGYFVQKTGREMFGVRGETEEPKDLFTLARSTYQGEGENRKTPVEMYARIRAGQPAQIAARDTFGHMASVEGPVPEKAVRVALTPEKLRDQLSRTGGTPFQCSQVMAQVEDGLSLPLSALNGLRRQVLEELGKQRLILPARQTGEFRPGVRYENTKKPPVFTVSVRLAKQVSPELLKRKPAVLYLPAGEGAENPKIVQLAQQYGVEVAAVLPRVCWDSQRRELDASLCRLRELGVTQALAGNLGPARQAQGLGFALRADYGLGVYNSQTLKELKRLSFLSATASFELKLAQIRDLSKGLPVEMLGYGRLPLMLTEHCIIHHHSGQHTCANLNQLTDRKGERFPVVQAFGCRNEILNCKKLFLADKPRDYQRLGLWAVRLAFTTENATECVQVLDRYLGRGDYKPNEWTRGLYYRDVE